MTEEPPMEKQPLETVCEYCGKPITRTASNRWRTKPPNSFFCDRSNNGSHFPAPPPVDKCPKCGREGHRGRPGVFWHYINAEWMGLECLNAAPRTHPPVVQTPEAELDPVNDFRLLLYAGWSSKRYLSANWTKAAWNFSSPCRYTHGPYLRRRVS